MPKAPGAHGVGGCGIALLLVEGPLARDPSSLALLRAGSFAGCAPQGRLLRWLRSSGQAPSLVALLRAGSFAGYAPQGRLLRWLRSSAQALAIPHFVRNDNPHSKLVTATIGRSHSRAHASHSIAVRSRNRDDGSEPAGIPSCS